MGLADAEKPTPTDNSNVQTVRAIREMIFYSMNLSSLVNLKILFGEFYRPRLYAIIFVYRITYRGCRIYLYFHFRNT